MYTGKFRKYHISVIVLLMLLMAGCSGEASSALSKDSETAVGFEPIPEDATVEALEAKSTPETSSGRDGDGAEDDNSESGDSEGFTMVFTGDFLLQDYTMAIYDQSGADGLLSEALQAELRNADLAMVNEEFPFGSGGEAADKTYTFQADPAYVSVLTDLGVDIVSLANNHVLDFGQDVLSQTFVTLDQAGIDYVGAGESLERAEAWISYDLNGRSVAILSASRVIPEVSWDVRNSQPGVFSTYDSTLMTEQIAAAKLENDYVVVYVHWGVENSDTPEDYQRQLAQDYIDAGADMVVGSHPHVLQGIEYYDGVPVIYSLGNFIFNYTTEQTALLKVMVDDAGEMSLQLLPAAASGARTYELDGDEALELYAYMESISFDVEIDGDGYVSEALE